MIGEEEAPFVGRGRSLLLQVLAIAQTRLELLALELEQERIALARELRFAAIAAICAWLAGFTLVMWIALAFSPEIRFVALGVAFVLFAGASLVSYVVLRRSLRRGPLFSRVVNQLRLDRAALGGAPGP